MFRAPLTVCVFALLGCHSMGEEASEGDIEFPSSTSRLYASQRPGMGAVVYDGGVMFRVWAPDAKRVFVMGEWNGWKAEAGELGNEFNGNFSADLAGAQRWQKYKLVIENKWGDRQERADPRAQRTENSSGASVIHDPGAYAWRTGFDNPAWNELVIYEMHLGTFNDAFGAPPGNWRSATEKIGYLASLGINAVEVMPVAEFPGDFSWGYNPSFPFAPESIYGTPEDMKNFIDTAHQYGIAVILDVVHNHWGPTDLPMWCLTGNCLGHGGYYFYTDDRKSTPWGDTRPDYGRKEVRDYILDSVRMWLQEYRIDGLRFDGTKYMRTIDGSRDIAEGYALLREINDVVDGIDQRKLMFAEDFGWDDVTQSTNNGGSGFDSQWDGRFVHPIRQAIVAQNDGDRDMNAVRDAVAHNFQGQATRRTIYTESHDEVANGRARVPEEIWPGNAGSWHSRKRSTLGAAILLTSPGIPLMFQGQEFNEDGYFSDQDPLHWERAGWFSGIVSMYRDLIHLRRNFANNTRGLRGGGVNVFHTNQATKVVAYHRYDQGGPGDDVVIVANFTHNAQPDYEVGFPRSGMWRVRMNTDSANYSPDFGSLSVFDTEANGAPRDGFRQSARVHLPPYSVVILSQ
jgi:1,4-alpha-glucan branching enzyme